jgi:hypothetical protein
MLKQEFSFTPGGGVSWDGKYIDVESVHGAGSGKHGPLTIDQVALSGSTATLAGTKQFDTGRKPKNPGLGTEFGYKA